MKRIGGNGRRGRGTKEKGGERGGAMAIREGGRRNQIKIRRSEDKRRKRKRKQGAGETSPPTLLSGLWDQGDGVCL